VHTICGLLFMWLSKQAELHKFTAWPKAAHGGADDSTSAQVFSDVPLSWHNNDSTDDLLPSWCHVSWVSNSKGKKYYKSSARSSNNSNQASYLFQKDISRKLLMAGVDSRRLLPFSERCGEADLLHCLTVDRAAESSLGVGLGARLDGMLIPLTSDMKSSPRSPNQNHCKLWSNHERNTIQIVPKLQLQHPPPSNLVMKVYCTTLTDCESCCYSTFSSLSPNPFQFHIRQLLQFKKVSRMIKTIINETAHLYEILLNNNENC